MNSRLGQELFYLPRSDVVSAGLGMAEIIAALERMLREKGEGRVEMPPKIGRNRKSARLPAIWGWRSTTSRWRR